jgi:SAM-dependent methyltransferase
MSDAAYWSERARQYGHTGWDDPLIYRYDQRLRLRAVTDVIATLGLPPGARCLDFGCGVGDFAARLSRLGYRVWAYDISETVLQLAARLNPAPNVAYTSHLDEALAEPLDLILSVTVLQHVVDDEAFGDIVRRFAQALQPDGRVLVMESFAPSDGCTGYLRLRTFETFVAAFETSGLQLETARSFYHPVDRPTPRFARYERNPLVRRLAARSRSVPAARTLHDLLAAVYAAGDRGYFASGDSPTRLLVFRLKDAG